RASEPLMRDVPRPPWKPLRDQREYPERAAISRCQARRRRADNTAATTAAVTAPDPARIQTVSPARSDAPASPRRTGQAPRNPLPKPAVSQPQTSPNPMLPARETPANPTPDE